MARRRSTRLRSLSVTVSPRMGSRRKLPWPPCGGHWPSGSSRRWDSRGPLTATAGTEPSSRARLRAGPGGLGRVRDHRRVGRMHALPAARRLGLQRELLKPVILGTYLTRPRVRYRILTGAERRLMEPMIRASATGGERVVRPAGSGDDPALGRAHGLTSLGVVAPIWGSTQSPPPAMCGSSEGCPRTSGCAIAASRGGCCGRSSRRSAGGSRRSGRGAGRCCSRVAGGPARLRADRQTRPRGWSAVRGASR